IAIASGAGLRVCTLGLIVLFTALAGRTALAAATLGDEYLVEVWHSEPGMPDDEIGSLTQDADGYLWIASRNAVARFDGVRFVAVTNASPPAMAMARDRLAVPKTGGVR